MNTTSVPLDRTVVNGIAYYKLRDSDDEYLVKRDPATGSWEHVDKLDKDLSDEELTQFYGIWHDQEVTSGHLWWKKVVRAKDGIMQADEVKPLSDWKQSQAYSVQENDMMGWPVWREVTLDKTAVSQHATPSGTYATLDEEWNIS